MTGPGIHTQPVHVLDNASTQRIEVNVSGQLQKIRIVLTNYGLVSVLEKMAIPFVPAIEIHYISSEEFSHAGSQGPTPGPHKKVKVIWYEDPCINGQAFGITQFGQPFEEILFVKFVLEDSFSFNASGHHMVKGSRRIQAWLSWHGPSIQYKKNFAPVKML